LSVNHPCRIEIELYAGDHQVAAPRFAASTFQTRTIELAEQLLPVALKRI